MTMKPIFEGWRRFINEGDVVPLKDLVLKSSLALKNLSS